GTIRTTAPLTPPLDPSANGFRVVVDGAERSIMDYTVPPGGYDPATEIGWAREGARGRWESPPREKAVQLQQVVLRDRSNATAARVEVKLSGTYRSVGPEAGGNDFRRFVEGGAVPPTITLVTDAPTAESGQCGTASFPNFFSPPTCSFRHGVGQ